MPKKKSKKVGKKLRKFSLETRLKSSHEFKEKTLQMFKGYIKAIIVWGSITRGDFTGKSDIDIYIIFDDTKMPIKKYDEVREKIDKDLYKIAHSIDPRLHPQPSLALTEFWDGIRACHPLFYNIIREGYAIYDTGFFIPMRKLLEWGKFPATREAAQLRMVSVPKRIARVKNVKLYMIAEDLYFALMDAAQALLMYIGVGPPAPKMAVKEFRKHLVDAGLIEEKYAKILEETIDFRKKVEYKEIKTITGKELDEWIKKSEDYIKRSEKLLFDLERSKKVNDIKKSYEVMIKASVAALKTIKKLPKDPKKLPEAFKKHLIDSGMVSPIYSDVFGKVIGMRKMLEDKKLDMVTDRDVYMSKEYVRRFVMDVRKALEKGPLPETLEKKVEKKMEKAGKLVETAKEVDKLKVGKVKKKTEEKLKKVEKKIKKKK